MNVAIALAKLGLMSPYPCTWFMSFDPSPRPLADVLKSSELSVSCVRASRFSGGEGPHHTQRHRLDEDETNARVIGSRYRADQWASRKATRYPPYHHLLRRVEEVELLAVPQALQREAVEAPEPDVDGVALLPRCVGLSPPQCVRLVTGTTLHPPPHHHHPLYLSLPLSLYPFSFFSSSSSTSSSSSSPSTGYHQSVF